MNWRSIYGRLSEYKPLAKMEELAGNVLKKLEGITDEEFLEVVLELAEDME